MLKQIVRVAVIVASLVTAAVARAQDLTLRYDAPAPDTHEGWERQARPIGNGRIGAMIIWDLFSNTVEGADALATDKNFRDEIDALRDRLVQPEVGRWGQLKEWMADHDDPGDTHRHVSHLFGLHPGRARSTCLPALPRAWPRGAVKGLRARGGFEVDLGWADGTLTSATVRRTAGNGEGAVRYGGKVVRLALKPGGARTFGANLDAQDQ